MTDQDGTCVHLTRALQVSSTLDELRYFYYPLCQFCSTILVYVVVV